MLYALILFAQEKADKAAPEVEFYRNPIFLAMGLMALFFFVVILPAQRRQRKEAEAITSNLKKNDEVVTSSGIIGVVTHIKDNGDEVTIKSEDARLRILKSSIVRIVKKDDATSAAPNTNIKPV